MKTELTIILHCSDFPGKTFGERTNVFLAVQKNQGLVEETPGDAAEKVFEIDVKVNKGKDDHPNFLGPYVFGKTGDKFLYLVWYDQIEGLQDRFRRAKIKLNALSWEQISQAMEQNQPLAAHIRLKDKNGGPVCASLKDENISWAWK